VEAAFLYTDRKILLFSFQHRAYVAISLFVLIDAWPFFEVEWDV